MKPYTVAFLVGHLTFMPVYAFGAEPQAEIICADDFPTRCTVEIKAGEKARFAGQLVTPDMAIYFGQTADSWERRMTAEVARTSSIAHADAARDKQVAAADLREMTSERDTYKRAADRTIFEHPVIVAALSVGATIAIFFVVKYVEKAAE